MLVYLKFYLLFGRFVKSESWPVIVFRPLTGVFGININTLYSKFWSLKEVFNVTNKAIGLYGFITLT